MSAIAYANLVYEKLYELLNAYPGFSDLLKAGNQLKTTAQKIQKMQRGQIADTPYMLLDFAEGVENVYEPTEAYSYNYTSIPADNWIEEWFYTYSIIVAHGTADVVAANLLCAQISEALRLGNPQLGLQYVVRWGPIRRRDNPMPIDPAAIGTYRRVSRLNIKTQLQFNGAQITE